jgi:hypothetical protein
MPYIILRKVKRVCRSVQLKCVTFLSGIWTSTLPTSTPRRFSVPTGESRLAAAEFRRQELITLGAGAPLTRKVLFDGNHNVLWDEIY